MFKKKLTDLLEVRKIIALLMVIVFAVLAFSGKLSGEYVQTIILMVITYYFAKQTALDTPDKNDKGE